MKPYTKFSKITLAIYFATLAALAVAAFEVRLPLIVNALAASLAVMLVFLPAGIALCVAILEVYNNKRDQP